MSDALRDTLSARRASRAGGVLDESIARLMRGYTPFQALSDPHRAHDLLPLLRAAESVLAVRVPDPDEVRRDAALDRMLLELGGLVPEAKLRGAIAMPRRSVLQLIAAVSVVAGVAALVLVNLTGIGTDAPVARSIIAPIQPGAASAERFSLEGTIVSIDLPARRLVLRTDAAERVVTIDDETEILRVDDRIELADLRAGERVRVEGVANDDGSVRAERIEVDAPDASSEAEQAPPTPANGTPGARPSSTLPPPRAASPLRATSGSTPVSGSATATPAPAQSSPSTVPGASPTRAVATATSPLATPAPATPAAEPTATPEPTEPVPLPTEIIPEVTPTLPPVDEPGGGPRPTRTPRSRDGIPIVELELQ